MRLAIIKDGVVINVVLWGDEPFDAPDGYEVVAATDTVGVGWLFDGKVFSEPVGESNVIP